MFAADQGIMGILGVIDGVAMLAVFASLKSYPFLLIHSLFSLQLIPDPFQRVN